MNKKEQLLKRAKIFGFSLAQLEEITQDTIPISPTQYTFRMVDTCAGEFEAYTPYYYSVTLQHPLKQSTPNGKKKKIIILGSGPIRIGQGIEFDYSTVHAVEAVQQLGFEAIIINNNPETVSTDFDISDRLYFEPLFLDEVLATIEREKDNLLGIIPQFGGQTAINLTPHLVKHDVPILGSSLEVIENCENRKLTSQILEQLSIPVTPWAVAATEHEAKQCCQDIGYPVLVRPSFVLGGRGMSIIFNDEQLTYYLKEAVTVTPELPVYIDKFLEDAIELDVDAVCDGKNVFHVVMEQIEEAGIHSGDSACVIPPQSLSQQVLQTIESYTKKIALEFNIIGLTNIQYAVKDETVYVIEINPRASRTIPFASKAINVPLAKLATQVVLGKHIPDILEGFKNNQTGKTNINPGDICIKEVVLPFRKLDLDPILRPEMQSTGEVIGVGKTFGEAFYKAQLAAGIALKDHGVIFISVADYAKDALVALAPQLKQCSFSIFTTEGTGKVLHKAGIETTILKKISEGSPNILDIFDQKDISLVFNLPRPDGDARKDSMIMRKEVVIRQIPFVSTIAGLKATLEALEYKNKLI